MNSWIISATAAHVVSSLALILSYAYVYGRYRERFIWWWMWAWVFYTIRFGFFLSGMLLDHAWLFTAAEQLSVLGSATALLQGSLLMAGKRPWRGWQLTGLPVAAWIVLTSLWSMPRAVTALPVYFYAGLLQIAAGVLFLRLPRPRSFGASLSGWALLVWGVHRLDYPYLRSVGWFAPWGFILGSVLGMMVALGLLLWYFELIQARMADSERRYRELFESAPMGIMIYSHDTGVTEANIKATELLGFDRESIKGITPKDIIHPEDQKTTPTRVVPGGYAPGESRRLDRRYIRKDGGIFTADVYLVRPGQEDNLLVIFQDVSEQRRIGEALAESELRFRQMAEHIDQIFYLGSPDYRECYYVSPAYERITGRTAQSLYGAPLSWMDIVHPEDRERIQAEISERVGTGHYESRFRILDAAGSVRTLRIQAFELTGEDGKPYRVAASLSDITEQEQAEKALISSEERFRTLTANIPGAVYRCANDTHWTMEYLSDGIECITGYPASDFLGNAARNFASLIHPEDREHVHAAVQRALAARAPYSIEFMLLDKFGGVHWIHGAGRGVFDDEGRLLWLDGVILDATERKNAENSLRKTLAFNQMILRHTPVGISVYDGETGQCIMANDVLSGILGDRLEQMMARNFRKIESWKTSGLDVMAEEALAGLGTRRKDVRFRSSMGKEVFLDCMFARFDVDGRPYLLRVASDISDRLRMEEIMIQTEKMMSVGGLAAGMAHEINNPLGGILQTAQVVIKRLTTDTPPNRVAAEEAGCSLDALHAFMEIREIIPLVEGMRDSATRAAKIVADMLEFSRQGDSRQLPADLGDILDKAVELCSNDYDLKKKYDFRHIRIEREYAPDLPQAPCARTQIEQVFMNILRNCSQAMFKRGDSSPPPRIVLRTARDGDFARIEIEDNGPGMDTATRRRIFEPFFTTKQPGEGTGLGLSVSYFIVTSNHKGTIEVQSEPGEGATFIIRLPLTGKEAPGADPAI